MTNSKKLSWILSQSIFIILLPWVIRLLAYLHPVAIGVVWICLTTLVFLMVYGLRGERLTISYPLFVSLFVIYNICLFTLLFFRPQDQSYGDWNFIPFTTMTSYFLESHNLIVATYNLLANIALFIPWGWFLLYHGQTWAIYKKLLLPLSCILLIEILQFFTNRGNFDIDDLLLNLLGVGIGYWLYPLFAKVVDIQT